MKIKDGYVLRQIAGQMVALPADETLDLDMMITLNGTGRFLWEHLEKGAEKEDLLKAIEKALGHSRHHIVVTLPYSMGGMVDKLHSGAKVIQSKGATFYAVAISVVRRLSFK